MGFLKISIQNDDSYETHVIDLGDVRNIVCKFPLQEDTAKEAHADEEVKIIYKDNTEFEIKLEDTPAVFTIFDSYGTELTKTDDLEVMSNSVMDAKCVELDFKDSPIG